MGRFAHGGPWYLWRIFSAQSAHCGSFGSGTSVRVVNEWATQRWAPCGTCMRPEAAPDADMGNFHVHLPIPRQAHQMLLGGPVSKNPRPKTHEGEREYPPSAHPPETFITSPIHLFPSFHLRRRSHFAPPNRRRRTADRSEYRSASLVRRASRSGRGARR